MPKALHRVGIDRITDLYWKDSQSTFDIAKSFGITPSAVGSYMRRHQIPRRSTIRLRSIRDLTIEERVWLACAIDSEGYILWPTTKTTKGGYGVRIGIVNTDKRYIDYAKELMGESAHVYLRKSAGNNLQGNYMPRENYCYDACITNKINAYFLLKQVLPYLIIKAKKAKDLMTEIEKTSELTVSDNTSNK